MQGIFPTINSATPRTTASGLLFSLTSCCFLPQQGMDAAQWTVVSLCMVGLVVIPYLCVLKRSRAVPENLESQEQNQQEFQSLTQHRISSPYRPHQHPQSGQYTQNECPVQANFQIRSGHRSHGPTQPGSAPQSQNQSGAQRHPHSQSGSLSQNHSHSQGRHQTQNGCQLQSARWPRSRSETREISGENMASCRRPTEPSRVPSITLPEQASRERSESL